MSSAPKIASGEMTEVDHLGVAAIDRRSLNLPNLITLLRFLLSLVLFALMDLDGWWRTSATSTCR